MLKRYHLVEIADQPWCPNSVRDGLTDYLQFVITVGKAYAPAEAPLIKALKDTNSSQIVDLCSGGGGPWLTLPEALRKEGIDVSVLLTDIHPNVEAFQSIETESSGKVKGYKESVNAESTPGGLKGFRTIFSAFHHFKPNDARLVLQDAVSRGEGIAVFEATHRSTGAIVATILAPVLSLFFTPFVRPFRLSRLFWTYIIPAIPLLILFDGVVSCLRTYTPDELLELASSVKGDREYSWSAGEVRAKPQGLPVTYLIGVPK